MLARQSLTKVCPCVGSRCLTASLSTVKDARWLDPRRRNVSTTSDSQSIFSPEASPWDEIFDDIKASPTSMQPANANLRSLKYHPTGRSQEHSKSTRTVSMTASESRVFGEMFSTIFQASTDSASKDRYVAGVGQVRSTAMGGLLGKLRHGQRRPRWTTEADEDLDRKKEEMELCETDIQLLEWAMREVFGESKRYEEQARLAASDSESSTPASSPGSAPPRTFSTLELQPASYPHLLAALMRSFRDKYKDPHLALAMFDHARNLSVASFVFGCTTPAYNELIETRWRCFRDLRGVCDAMEEMRVNGIELDNRTRLLAETIRREVGERTLWQEESSLGSGEVWEMVGRLERLAVREPPRRRNKKNEPHASTVRNRKWTSDQETWKAKAMEIGAKEDHWAFDKWESPATTPRTRKKSAMRY